MQIYYYMINHFSLHVLGGVTSTTWNPDSIDHTLNPNKSRKPTVNRATTPVTPTLTKGRITSPTRKVSPLSVYQKMEIRFHEPEPARKQNQAT